MRNRRRKKRGEEHIDESWLLPYADKVTLLLGLFIVLFSMSQVDKAKVEELAEQFAYINLENASGSSGVLKNNAPPMDVVVEDKEKDEEKEGKKEENKKETLIKQENADLQELKEEIDNYIKQHDLSISLKTDITETGLLITILDNALYDSGKAVVKPEGKKLAKQIAKLLEQTSQRNIIIAGHTDNVPVGQSKFKSNWDLSTTRATNFLEILLKNDKLRPNKFSIKGYGEFQPTDTNDTKQGRQNNRRVEVLILPNYTNNKFK